MKAYISYGEEKITVHKFADCELAKVGPDEKIRHVMLNQESISRELDRFRNRKHDFSGEPGMGDMWLIFDFQDADFEMALLEYVKKLIGFSNNTIGKSATDVHC